MADVMCAKWLSDLFAQRVEGTDSALEKGQNGEGCDEGHKKFQDNSHHFEKGNISTNGCIRSDPVYFARDT